MSDRRHDEVLRNSTDVQPRNDTAVVRDEVITWAPSAEFASATRLNAFMAQVSERTGRDMRTYRDIWQWSVTEPGAFWAEVAEFFGVIGERMTGPDAAVALADSAIPGATWFPGAKLNYAENVLQWAREPDHAKRPAIVSIDEANAVEEISWREVEARVAGVADAFRAWGIEPGDRIAAVLPNVAEAIIGLLAAASVGAIWTISSPDLSAEATLMRLQQLAPRVLIVADEYRYNGKRILLDGMRADLLAGLPSIERTVVVRARAVGVQGADSGAAREPVSFAALEQREAEPHYLHVPFSHPLWVLFSSGTTGAPKGIVHGHGGMLLEALKVTGLNQNLGPEDRYFVVASTSWMVWNNLVNTMPVGASVVVYSGSPTLGGAGRQFEIISLTKATMFATGAAYLSLVERSGATPADDYELSTLHSILSTGSPLPDSTWLWVHRAVKSDVRLGSDSGGTDICSGFIGSNPLEPVRLGELQGPLLGVAVEARNDVGERVYGQVGEMVVTQPLPSMPLYLWNDESGERYRSSYFTAPDDTLSADWHHGDWITEIVNGGYIVHGRSDATLNRGGVRLGTAEIYAAVQDLQSVEQSLVIGAELRDGHYYMPMFVVVSEGVAFNADLEAEIVARIGSKASPRHVPDAIVPVPAIPVTHSGKRVEVSVKKLYAGLAPENAVQREALANPDSIDWFIEDARRFIAARASCAGE